ncbi:MAG: MFS transporter [Rhodothermales bacterium]
MHPEYNRRYVFAAACLGNFVFGIVITVLGTILPSFLGRFAVGKTVAGSSLTVLSIGILVGSLAFGPVADRYGFKGLMLGSSALIAAGLVAMALAPDYELLLLAVAITGFGGGVINGATNALVSDISRRRRSADLSVLGIFFGIGAFGIPLVMGFLLDDYSYTALTAAVSIPVLIALGYFAAIRFPAPKQPRGFPMSRGRRLLQDPAVLLFGAMLFLQSGIEITTGGWTTTFFQEELAAPAGTSAYGLSLFWMGMTVARVILARLLDTAAPSQVLYACTGLAVVGALVVIQASSVPVAYAGIFLTGAGLSAAFPVTLGFAGDLYPKLSGTTFSVLFVMALTGGSVLPFVAGVLGSAFGLRYALLITPVSALIIALLLPRALRQVRRFDRTP